MDRGGSNDSNRIKIDPRKSEKLMFTVNISSPTPWLLSPLLIIMKSREYLLLLLQCVAACVASQNTILILFQRNSPYSLRDKLMFKT